jgi:hypothetical protein
MEPSEYKLYCITQFVRGGGSQQTHHGHQSHAHSGTRVFHHKGQRWFDRGYFDHDEPRRQARRRNFRRGAEMEID